MALGRCARHRTIAVNAGCTNCNAVRRYALRVYAHQGGQVEVFPSFSAFTAGIMRRKFPDVLGMPGKMLLGGLAHLLGAPEARDRLLIESVMELAARAAPPKKDEE